MKRDEAWERHQNIQNRVASRLEGYGYQTIEGVIYSDDEGVQLGELDILIPPHSNGNEQPRIYEIKGSRRGLSHAITQLNRAYSWMKERYGWEPKLIYVTQEGKELRSRRVKPYEKKN